MCQVSESEERSFNLYAQNPVICNSPYNPPGSKWTPISEGFGGLLLAGLFNKRENNKGAMAGNWMKVNGAVGDSE